MQKSKKSIKSKILAQFALIYSLLSPPNTHLSDVTFAETVKLSDLINYDKRLDDIIDKSCNPGKGNSKEDNCNISLVVSKKDHVAYLVQGNKIIKSYPIAMSWNYMNDKEREGDCGVPEGVYYITAKASGQTFFKFSPLNYPNTSDARRALKKGIINKEEYKIIVEANKKKASFIPATRAGSAVGLHGSSCKKLECLGVGDFDSENKAFNIVDWTLGCIAFNNFDWDEIIKYVKVWKTPIYIVKEVNLEKIKNIKDYLKEVWEKENQE